MAELLTAVTARPAAIMSVWVPASEPMVHSTATSPFRSVAAVEGSTRPLPGAGRKCTVTPANRLTRHVENANDEGPVEGAPGEGALPLACCNANLGRRLSR